MRQQQRGMTLISFIIVAAVVVSVGIILSRVAPLYSEFSRAVGVLKDVQESPDLAQKDAMSIRERVLKDFAAAGVTNVKPKNLVISRVPGKGVRFELRYEAPTHVFGHLGVIAKFDRVLEPK